MSKRKYAIIDIETTGGMSRRDKITEIAIVIHDGTKVLDQYATLINPGRSIPPEITRITGITNDMVKDAPKFFEVAKEIVEYTEGTIFVAHNVRFDYSFIKEAFKSLGYTFTKRQLCTVKLTRRAFPGLQSYSLGNLIRHFGIAVNDRHRALDDALATSIIFGYIIDKIGENGDVKDFINLGIKEAQLPKGLKLKDLHELPEEPGVYYFLNEHQRVIYIGKAKNIKTRVFQHFNKITTKSAKLYQQVYEIAFELAGNELAALLMEAEEIKLRQPEINKAMRRKEFSHGLFMEKSKDGYLQLSVEKQSSKNAQKKLISEYSKLAFGREHLVQLIETYEICAKFCFCRGLTKEYCHCFGSCSEIDMKTHNETILEIEQALQALFDHDFIIIEQGRTVGEKTVILIEEGRYQGLGFISEEDAQYGIEELKEAIKPTTYYPIMNKLIWNYLKDHKPKMIKI